MHDPWLEHKQRLLQRRRCPACAERAPARRILRGLPCAHCGETMRVSGSEDRAAEVLAAISHGWETARKQVYAAVLLANFLSGWVPLLASVVTAGAMLAANVLLIRRPLRWLPPVQRAATRFGSRLWLVVLLMGSFVLHTLAAPLIAAWGLGAVASGVVGTISTYLYVEGSLWLIRRAVAHAARDRR